MYRILLILLFIGLTLPFIASAFLSGPIVECGRKDQNPCTLCDIFVMAKNIIKFLMDLIIVIAPIFVVIGGIIILTAGIKPDQVALGKKIITSALVGIVIALLAWVVLGTLFNVLAKPAGEDGMPWAWNKIECSVDDTSSNYKSNYELLNDVDSNGKISSGDILQYSFIYTNTYSGNLSNLSIIIDYDQTHIFSINEISNNGINNGDKITWDIGNLNINQSITVSYEFTLAKDFSDLSNNSKSNTFAKFWSKLYGPIIKQVLAGQNQVVSLQNTIIITSDQLGTEIINDPIEVIVSTILGLTELKDIPNNPVYFVGYYEEPDDDSSKWPSYDWYFNQVANNGGNIVRLSFYNSHNPFYSISPWENNNCSQPNNDFYTSWLEPIINKANSKGIYVILTLYNLNDDWPCNNKTQANRQKTYDKIINYLSLPRNKVIIEINWEQKIISNSWLQDQAKYFEDRKISTIITNWRFDDHNGAGNNVSTYAGRHRDWNRATSLEYFDSGKPTIWTERFFALKDFREIMTPFEARQNIYRDALTARQPILFYYIRWSKPDEPNLPSVYLQEAGHAVKLAKKIPWKAMIPQERYSNAVGNKGYWAIKDKEAVLGWVNNESQVTIDITGWSGNYNYWWFNPRNGMFNYINAVSGTPINNTFTVSTPNSSEDWVFVLKGTAIAPTHKKCVGTSCQNVSGEGADQCTINADCAVLPKPLSFTWNCDNKFATDCYYLDRCIEDVLWMSDDEPAYDEYIYTFDSFDSTGAHSCQVRITTGAFRYEASRYQDNEKVDVYINNTYIGTTDDLYCNTGDGLDCRSCEHVITILNKENINIFANNNELKLVGHDSHGLIKLEVNCNK